MITIQNNVSLQPYNTFGIDATARFFVVINTVEELTEVLQMSDYQYITKLILGGGSNLLLTQNFEGLVIKINLKAIGW